MKKVNYLSNNKLLGILIISQNYYGTVVKDNDFCSWVLHQLNNNEKLTDETLDKCGNVKPNDKILIELHKSIRSLARHISHKYGLSYDEIDDVVNETMMGLLKCNKKFDYKRSKNAFAYITQCVKNEIFKIYNKRKKTINLLERIAFEQSLL